MNTVHNSWKLYKRLLHIVKRFWPAFLFAILANMVFAAMDAWLTYLLKPLLDRGFIEQDVVFIKLLPFMIVGLFLIRGAANFGSKYFMARVGRSTVMYARQDMFKHLMYMPASYFDKSSSGQVLAKLLYDVDQIAKACTDSLTTMVRSTFLVIGLLIVLFTISWPLTLLFLTSAPVVVLVFKIANKRLRKLSRNVQTSVGSVAHIAEEAMEGYSVVRTFGGEQYEIDKFNKATRRQCFRDLKGVVTNGLSVPAVQLAGAIAMAIIIYLVTSPTTGFNISAGSFAAFMAAMMALLKPMKDLTNMNAPIQKGLAAAESIFGLIDTPMEQDTGTKRIERVKGGIEIRNLSFSYPNHDRAILSGINLTIEPGQIIALVGYSGSGKTTLTKLLLRFYVYEQGEILIDGVNIKDIVLKDLRSQFALVSQQINLFHDTVAKNIAYGTFDNVDLAKVQHAATAAYAMEFIDDLPDRLDTLIGENGVLLSGGQRQRVAIARAIFKDAPILILDEATSALDTLSERKIQQGLEQLMKNRTSIVIAHRLSTIENADVIVVMDKGQVVEMGSHHELLTQNGHYAKLHVEQFKQKSKTDV